MYEASEDIDTLKIEIENEKQRINLLSSVGQIMLTVTRKYRKFKATK